MGSLRRSKLGLAFLAATLALLVGTIGALALLWPRDEISVKPGQQTTGKTVEAEVVVVAAVQCPSPELRGCRSVSVKLLEGAEKDRRVRFSFTGSAADPGLEVGDHVRMTRNPAPPAGAPAGVAEPYSFVDFERRNPMLLLVLAFAALVVVLGRLRGALSLVGLAISLAVVIEFILPAILDGRPPVAVAIAGALAVMLTTIALAHGLGPKSIAAVLGTAASLGITIALATIFTEAAHLTGLSSEESTLLLSGGEDISLEGLVLAGMIIAALGVLDDVTVSQASTVMALRRANPTQRFGELYRSALSVGRDHVSATVNTLVLAYVGASLPVLLIFTVGDTPFVDAINREVVAQQVVGTLVGSVGLIAAVPITTALAALLASRLPGEALPAEAHAHAH